MKGWLLALAFVAFADQATPPRDTPASAPTGTAIVRGRVRSAATGDPLHRVRLTFNGPNPTPPSTVTDTRGEFEMTGLPAGTYSITAARAGYLTQFYGQQRPHEAGRTVDVRAGEVIEGVDMVLVRGGVLAGSITDDVGDPYPGVRVEALEFRYLRGRRLLLQTASATTNDLGQFRIGALAPGTYFLRASTPDTWDGDDDKLTYAYAVTYFPGVTGTDQAQSVTVAVEQQIAGLDFGMRPGRAARITGIVQNAAGEPLASQQV
jgi:Carboxypeptidase regulatory-like domain